MATKKETAEAEVKEEKELNPMRPVTIRLFKDAGKYKDDVFVGYNGRSYLIQRGIDVEVPWAVAEIIRESLEQDQAAAELIMKEEQEFHNNVEKRLS